MASKIDKEFLKKNQFWIGLGAFVLLWLVGVIAVIAGGGESKDKKEYESAFTGVKGLGARAKTKAHEEPWVSYGNKFAGLKNAAWKEGWDLQQGLYEQPGQNPQNGLYSWPKGMEAPEYPTSELSLDARTKYRNDYKAQYAKLEKDRVVWPVEMDKGFDNILKQQNWENAQGNPPTREEIWLAQEDFWVKRDLLYALRAALDHAARFKEIERTVNPKGAPGGAKGLGEGEIARYKLRNTSWEIELIIKKGAERPYAVSEKSTIKNVHPSRRTQALTTRAGNRGLNFRLWQEGHYPMQVPVAGALLPHDATAEFGAATDLSAFEPAKPLVFDQEFEWENAPIRRIEALDVPYQSHRTVTTALRARDDLKKLDPTATELEAAKDGKDGKDGKPPNQGPGVPKMPGGPAGERPGGSKGGGDATALDLTPNNAIPRNRYLHVSEQCRHLPVAMRLIVDPAHVHDVLAAVINSRLRIQVTQVQLARASDIVRQAPGDKGKGGEGALVGMGPRAFPPGYGRPGVPGGPRMPGMPPGGSMRPPGGPKMPPGGPKMPPVFPMGKDGPGTKTEDTSTTAPTADLAPLVELTIYGVACLYERPTKPVSTAAPSPPTAKKP